jgi:hypothetical protein
MKADIQQSHRELILVFRDLIGTGRGGGGILRSITLLKDRPKLFHKRRKNAERIKRHLFRVLCQIPGIHLYGIWIEWKRCEMQTQTGRKTVSTENTCVHERGY